MAALSLQPVALPTTRPKAVPVARRRGSQPDLRLTLVQTERIAESVADAVNRDPFAAAVVAYDWLRRVDDVQPSMFDEVEAQRAWAEAWCVLDGATRSAKRDASTRAALVDYLACSRIAEGFERELGPDPLRRLEELRGDVLRAKRALAWHAVGALGALGPALFFLVAGVVLGVAGAPLVWTGALALGLAAYTCVRWLRSLRACKRAAASAARAERIDAERRAFVESPRGGRFLAAKRRQHPLLGVLG